MQAMEMTTVHGAMFPVYYIYTLDRAHPRKCDGVQLPNLVHKYVLVEIFVRHDAFLYLLTDALSFPHTTL